MKTFIAIPCMETVHTEFFKCMLNIQTGTEPIIYGVSCSSLIYDARNALAKTAIDAGADRVLWLDSDMIFQPDIVQRLSADMDEGREIVSALYFTRKNPVSPVVYSKTGYSGEEDGKLIPYAEKYIDYPKDKVFECAGFGFGACMVSTDLMKHVYDVYGAPFAPSAGFGEDLTFCRRLEELGIKMYCDSRIKCGHIANTIVTEESYLNSLKL